MVHDSELTRLPMAHGYLRLYRAFSGLGLGLALLLAPATWTEGFGAPAPLSFMYQGQLLDNKKAPKDGDQYDILFTLYNAETNGAALGTALTVDKVPVYNGVFVVSLDFGPGVFNGTTRWIQIAVRKQGSKDAREILTPRQPITYTPQALYALTVADGAVTGSKVSGVLNPASIPNLSAARITSGTLSDARLPTNLARLNGTNVFTGTNEFRGALVATNASNRISGIFVGNGAGLSNLSLSVATLDASKITSGTLSNARLPGNLAWLNGTNVFTGTNEFRGALVATNASNRISGTFVGNGAGLSNLSLSVATLDASKITSGTLSNARLPGNLAWLNGTNVFTGTNEFRGALMATNASNQFTGAFTGYGAGLTGLDASQVTSGVMNPARIPPLDAGKITTGTLADDRLSTGIARVSDLAALSAQIASLNARLAAITGGPGTPPPDEAMYASSDPADAGLLARGLRVVVRVPSPAWVNGGTAGAPSARSGHSGVWTGQEWILWGGSLGRDGNGFDLYAGTGGRYQPDADAWTPVSTISTPTARSRHTAVWSGSEMIVWGGYGGTGYLADGGRFSVSNNLWNGLPPSALSARDGHGAVWTGNRMLIWGGNNRMGRLSDGALFNPADGTWTMLPTAGAPAARANATVLWATDRLLVWGGDGASGYRADGAQLLVTGGVPSTAWQPFSTASAPTARSGHTAVWTGTTMLVWGGENRQGHLADGAAYDPVANAWTPISMTGAPVARKLHSAVWTGTEMMVYGGATATGATATGAIYDPALHRWRDLTNPGSPMARQATTASWTGNQALFFGGANSSGTLLAALQRLDPQPAWYFFRKP